MATAPVNGDTQPERVAKCLTAEQEIALLRKIVADYAKQVELIDSRLDNRLLRVIAKVMFFLTGQEFGWGQNDFR